MQDGLVAIGKVAKGDVFHSAEVMYTALTDPRGEHDVFIKVLLTDGRQELKKFPAGTRVVVEG